MSKCSKKEADSHSELPMNITRRDFVGSTMIGAGSALLTAAAPGARAGGGADSSPSAKKHVYSILGKDWTGPGGVGDYANSNGNTHSVVNAAHSIRDGFWKTVPSNMKDAGEEFDLVIVGGGISGLTAARKFLKDRDGKGKVLILDNHPIFGGEAKGNQLKVDGTVMNAPQGSNMFLWPAYEAEKANIFWHPVWRELGLPMGDEPDAPTWDVKPTGTKKDLSPAGDNYTHMMIVRDLSKTGYFFADSKGRGQWVKNAWENGYRDTPWPKAVIREMAHLDNFVLKDYPEDPKALAAWFDSMTYKEYLTKYVGITRPEVFNFLNPVIAAYAPGLGCDVISAMAARDLFAPGTTTKKEREEELKYGPPPIAGASFPGGNATIARYLLKDLIPDAIGGKRNLHDITYGKVKWNALDRDGQALRVRVNATVVDVQHNGPAETAKEVNVTYINNESGLPTRIKSKAVIMAGGQWINKHVLTDAPADLKAAMNEFSNAPILTVNVAVRHWRFMEKLGISSARWFEGFGWYTNVRAPMSLNGKHEAFGPDKPTILTFYIPFTDVVSDSGAPHKAQAIIARNALFNLSFGDIETRIRKQLTDMFGDYGFDDKRDIASIVANRWGHAYVVPQPGFFHGVDGKPAFREIVRQGYGRVRFSHSELTGTQLWVYACQEGERAANEVQALV